MLSAERPPVLDQEQPAFERNDSESEKGLDAKDLNINEHLEDRTVQDTESTSHFSLGNGQDGIFNMLTKLTGDALSIFAQKGESCSEPRAKKKECVKVVVPELTDGKSEAVEHGLDTVLQYKITPRRKSSYFGSSISNMPKSLERSGVESDPGKIAGMDRISLLRRKTLELIKTPFHSDKYGQRNIDGNGNSGSPGLERKSLTDDIELINMGNTCEEANLIDRLCRSLLIHPVET